MKCKLLLSRAGGKLDAQSITNACKEITWLVLWLKDQKLLNAFHSLCVLFVCKNHI